MKLQSLIDELSRRRVVRVLVAYCVAAFGALQGLDTRAMSAVVLLEFSSPTRFRYKTGKDLPEHESVL